MSTVGKALVCNNGDVLVRIITSHGETLVPPGADVEISLTCDENWLMSFGVAAVQVVTPLLQKNDPFEIDAIKQRSVTTALDIS